MNSHAELIRYLHNQGLNCEQIYHQINPNGNIPGLSLSNINTVIHHIKCGRTDFSKRKPTGRHVDEELHQRIKNWFYKYPYISCAQISKDLHCSTKTVIRVIRDELGYECKWDDLHHNCYWVPERHYHS